MPLQCLQVCLTRREVPLRPWLLPRSIWCKRSQHACRACAQIFKDFEPEDAANNFELHLALMNAHGEAGDVAGVRAEVPAFLAKHGKKPYAASYAYMALLKALR